MKNLASVFSILAFIGVAILFGMNFSKNKNSGSGASTSQAVNVPVSGKIAYVDIDSLEAHYDYLKAKKEEFKTRQAQMEGELQRSYQQMQSDYAELQKKAQAGTLTQPESEAAQKRLSQMDQSLQTRKEALTETLLKDQEEFNKELRSRLDNFLNEYNKDKHFDYILSYSSAATGSILFANKGLNVTDDVIKGINELAKKMEGDKKKNK